MNKKRMGFYCNNDFFEPQAGRLRQRFSLASPGWMQKEVDFLEEKSGIRLLPQAGHLRQPGFCFHNRFVDMPKAGRLRERQLKKSPFLFLQHFPKLHRPAQVRNDNGSPNNRSDRKNFENFFFADAFFVACF
jgi:hypothetical protein